MLHPVIATAKFATASYSATSSRLMHNACREWSSAYYMQGCEFYLIPLHCSSNACHVLMDVTPESSRPVTSGADLVFHTRHNIPNEASSGVNIVASSEQPAHMKGIQFRPFANRKYNRPDTAT